MSADRRRTNDIAVLKKDDVLCEIGTASAQLDSAGGGSCAWLGARVFLCPVVHGLPDQQRHADEADSAGQGVWVCVTVHGFANVSPRLGVLGKEAYPRLGTYNGPATSPFNFAVK